MMRPLPDAPQMQKEQAPNLDEDGIAFRPMTEDDIPIMMDIQNEAHEFPWSEGIMRDCIGVGYDCWVMEREEKAIGFGVMSVNGEESHILQVSIRPSEQGRGYGRRLMVHLLMISMVQGAQKSLLEVRASQKRAINLYERLGFTRTNVRKEYYPAVHGREDAWAYELDFSNLA